MYCWTTQILDKSFIWTLITSTLYTTGRRHQRRMEGLAARLDMVGSLSEHFYMLEERLSRWNTLDERPSDEASTFIQPEEQ